MTRTMADLHLHGRYAQATSKELSLQKLEQFGKVKGIDILGTGDAQHPKWAEHIGESLSEIDGSGIYQTKGGQKFILTTEISFVFTQDGKGRRIHLCTFLPSIEVLNQFREFLLSKGRIDYDGRPIFGMSCAEYVEKCKEISQDIEIIPAHIWTPWFGAFGSKSGFDSLKDCFGDQVKHIHAVETGLSSDPPMNWRVKELDKYNLVSFSDSHSFWPWRIGREATIFDLKKTTYKSLINAIRTGEGLTGTVETDPAYGIYHWDGHRNCGISYSAEESKKRSQLCEKCGKKVTIGVESRVEELAERPEGYTPKNPKKHYKLLPLSEIISGVMSKGIATKTVWQEFNKLIGRFKTEFDVLLDAPEDELAKTTTPQIAEAIIKNRSGQIKVRPGYDGVYGVPILGKNALKIDKNPGAGMQFAKKKERAKKEQQKGLGSWS